MSKDTELLTTSVKLLGGFVVSRIMARSLGVSRKSVSLLETFEQTVYNQNDQVIRYLKKLLV